MRRLMQLITLFTAWALLVACTGQANEKATPPASETSEQPEESKTEQLIALAQRQAAQYDYDEALATLATAEADAPDDAEEIAPVQQEILAAQAEAVPWPDNATISHIFYHSLIVDADRAFNDPSQANGYNQFMVTMYEFEQQLAQIHANGYVLIHPDRIAVPGADGVMTPEPILLPPGKKPLVLSVDDVNYYEYMEGAGFADRLIINEDGDVENEYTDASGETVEGSYDVPPIVDDFIDENPDFSYRGDKGTLAVTGYNGVLGYRSSVSSYGDNPQTHAALAEATVVADALKADGWKFASHTWGHINMTNSGMSTIAADTQRWNDEVRPVVGDTPLLIYPFGADISGVPLYGPANQKFVYLHDEQGFDYYFNVDGSQQYWMQIGSQSVRQARINVDGITLQKALNGSTLLTPFFDPVSTIDPKRPLPVPGF